eukprot:14273387-Alexandrium_andersonii.AAC.1
MFRAGCRSLVGTIAWPPGPLAKVGQLAPGPSQECHGPRTPSVVGRTAFSADRRWRASVPPD